MVEVKDYMVFVELSRSDLDHGVSGFLGFVDNIEEGKELLKRSYADYGDIVRVTDLTKVLHYWTHYKTNEEHFCELNEPLTPTTDWGCERGDTNHCIHTPAGAPVLVGFLQQDDQQ